MKECVSLQSVADREVFLPNDEIGLYDLQSGLWWERESVCVCVCVCVCQGRAETFGGAGAQNIKGAHETRL